MLENQVCSMELSKRLEVLGLNKKSIFVWEYLNEACYGIKYLPYAVVPNQFTQLQIYKAYTSTELIDLLPPCIDFRHDTPFNNGWLVIQKRSAKNIQYIVSYVCDTYLAEEMANPSNPQSKTFCKTHDENLSNALAKMAIFLLENKLMEINNERK